MSQKISCLVTGGSGCLGTQIVKLLLERGYRVATFDVVAPTTPMANVHSIQGDITNSVAFNKALRETKAEIVFHTAAIMDLRPIPSPKMYHVNIEGTRVVVEQCQQSKHCKTLVYTSSMEVVSGILPNGKTQILNGCDETVPIPEHHFMEYAATKATAEQIVLNADDKEETLRTCSIRPGFIVGEGSVFYGQAMDLAKQHWNYLVSWRLPAKLSCVNPKSAADLHIIAAAKINESHGQSWFARDFDANDTEMKMFAFQDTDISFVFWPFWLIYAMAWMLDRWERQMHSIFNLFGWTRTTSRNVVDIAALNVAWSDALVSSKKAHDALGWRPLMSEKETMKDVRQYANGYWRRSVAERNQ